MYYILEINYLLYQFIIKWGRQKCVQTIHEMPGAHQRSAHFASVPMSCRRMAAFHNRRRSQLSS